ncbi:hypothetical protein [Laspinema palackyanum]
MTVPTYGDYIDQLADLLKLRSQTLGLVKQIFRKAIAGFSPPKLL